MPLNLSWLVVYIDKSNLSTSLKHTIIHITNPYLECMHHSFIQEFYMLSITMGNTAYAWLELLAVYAQSY